VKAPDVYGWLSTMRTAGATVMDHSEGVAKKKLAVAQAAASRLGFFTPRPRSAWRAASRVP